MTGRTSDLPTSMETAWGDLLWVEKFTGDVTVWYNNGVRSAADRPSLKGSIVEWSKAGALYFGQTRGPNEYFMDYDGDGRADLIRVAPHDNTGDVYLNKCPTTGGDDSTSDSNLPAYTGNNNAACGSDDTTSQRCTDDYWDYCEDEYWLPEDHHQVIGPERRSALERRGSDSTSSTKVTGADGRTWILDLIFLAYLVWKALMRLDAQGV